jgi:hypothetical protein
MCIENKNLFDSSSTNVKSILRVKSIGASIGSGEIHSSALSSCSSESIKSVQFDSIQIREYNIIMGDNPSCSSGPPISLGWQYSQKDPPCGISLELYEVHRKGHRRSPYQMRIPPYVRHQTLREWDVPARDIMTAQEICEITKKQRYQTMQREHRNLIIKDLFQRLMRKALFVKEVKGEQMLRRNITKT